MHNCCDIKLWCCAVCVCLVTQASATHTHTHTHTHTRHRAHGSTAADMMMFISTTEFAPVIYSHLSDWCWTWSQVSRALHHPHPHQSPPPLIPLEPRLIRTGMCSMKRSKAKAHLLNCTNECVWGSCALSSRSVAAPRRRALIRVLAPSERQQQVAARSLDIPLWILIRWWRSLLESPIKSCN